MLFYFQSVKAEINYVCLSQASRDIIDASLTSAIHHDVFLVIDNIHLASPDHLFSLYNRLVRLQKQSMEGKQDNNLSDRGNSLLLS